MFGCSVLPLYSIGWKRFSVHILSTPRRRKTLDRWIIWYIFIKWPAQICGKTKDTTKGPGQNPEPRSVDFLALLEWRSSAHKLWALNEEFLVTIHWVIGVYPIFRHSHIFTEHEKSAPPKQGSQTCFLLFKPVEPCFWTNTLGQKHKEQKLFVVCWWFPYYGSS